jgi:pimeloyl-ACP methyl ester carboxylesterase
MTMTPSMEAQKDRRAYGAIAAIDSSQITSSSLGIQRDRVRSSVLLSLAVGAALLLLTLLLISDRTENTLPAFEPFEMFDMEGASDHKHTDPQLFYHDQLVDHFSDEKDPATWSHRYYASSKYFKGPGHPIFLVLGGEGPAHGLFYPFINEHLAKKFKAYVLQPEHRFYGKSQPIKIKDNSDYIGLLTPQQAIADFLQLLQHKQKELGCSRHKSHPHYCPVITVGGSYPGFLSAMMRFVHPDLVDIAYAASAPLSLYSQELDPNAYYEKVTDSAERASAGCPAAIKATLLDIVEELKDTTVPFQDTAKRMGVCLQTIPDYITTNEVFSQEIMMIVGCNFADFNMDNYPPTQDTTLAKACHIFQKDHLDSYQKLGALFKLLMTKKEKCFDLMSQVPKGPNATISTADWSGAGPGKTGRTWEFQLCTDLIVRTGYSEKSMFPVREWSLEWLTDHCQSRFGVTPQPYGLVDEWGFNDLVAGGASRILFTNGLNDGWSVLSVLESLSNSIVAINFPNGAHHSDLSHEGPSAEDTEDITRGFSQITNLLTFWLEGMKHTA